jgi:hypothetical protein
MQSDIDAFEVADRKERSWIYLERDLPGKPQVSQGSSRSSDDQEIGITE